MRMRSADKASGFTLVEMMIVIAIATVIVAIALPSYADSTRKSRRVLAKSALLDLASREQRWYSLNNNYTATAGDLNYDQFPVEIKDGNGVTVYSLNVATDQDNGKGYVAKAEARGDQVKDACGNYSLDGLGGQSQTGSAKGCW